MADANTKETVLLNEMQSQFLTCMMKNLQSKPDVDWDAVATEQKMTAKSAKERYRVLCIKLGWSDAPSSSPKKSATTTPKKSATTTPKKATPKKPTGVTKRAGKAGTKAQKTPNGKGKGKDKDKDKESNEAAQGESELEHTNEQMSDADDGGC